MELKETCCANLVWMLLLRCSKQDHARRDQERTWSISIDGSHAANMDGKGHSGLVVTMGTGAMMNMSKKLGLNTTSSTETGIVSTGEWFPKCA